MELASPAADWLPVINGQRPDFPGDTQVDIRWTDGTEWDAFGRHYALDSLDACWPQEGIYVTHIRLAPAQPAECDCGTGQVHSIHCKSNPQPPSERAEATINAVGQEQGTPCGRQVSLPNQVGNSVAHSNARVDAPRGGNLSQKPMVGSDANAQYPCPVPAAPQRQNLCSCGWPTGGKFIHGTRCSSMQRSLPPLHRVTVERERVRFLLAYKGRIPMTEPPRVVLSSLPVNIWKEWK